MVIPGIGVAALLVAAALMWRFLSSWFGRLDEESKLRVSQFTFINPSAGTARIPAPSLFSEPSKSLSIVIPAYNEEDRLPSTLDETLAYLQRRRDRQGPNFTYEVVIVDDGSKDGTVKEAFNYVRRHGFDAVRVLQLAANRGKGYAVKAGMMCARGQNLLFMDADGATRVSDVELLEAKMKEVVAQPVGRQQGQRDQLGFVLGSRAHLQEAALAKRTWVRNILMHGFHALVTLVVGNAIRDTQCGFKVSIHLAPVLGRLPQSLLTFSVRHALFPPSLRGAIYHIAMLRCLGPDFGVFGDLK